VLQQIGPTTVHYSEDLRIGLKAVSPEGVTEVVLVDDQADFNPRTVDLGIFEQLAAKAEVDGQTLYAEQIRELAERWLKALSNLPESSP